MHWLNSVRKDKEKKKRKEKKRARMRREKCLSAIEISSLWKYKIHLDPMNENI